LPISKTTELVNCPSIFLMLPELSSPDSFSCLKSVCWLVLVAANLVHLVLTTLPPRTLISLLASTVAGSPDSVVPRVRLLPALRVVAPLPRVCTAVAVRLRSCPAVSKIDPSPFR